MAHLGIIITMAPTLLLAVQPAAAAAVGRRQRGVQSLSTHQRPSPTDWQATGTRLPRPISPAPCQPPAGSAIQSQHWRPPVSTTVDLLLLRTPLFSCAALSDTLGHFSRPSFHGRHRLRRILSTLFLGNFWPLME